MPIPSFPSALSIEAELKTYQTVHIMKKSPFVFPDENPNESLSLDDIVLPELRLKTAHKQAEDAGELAPEPLLTVNPHRFVLFPIQDSEVSLSDASGRHYQPSCLTALSSFVHQAMGHVQTSRSLLLDRRRD